MPQSLVLNLETQSTVSSNHLQGYSLQQLFFNLVDVVDPDLGRVLRRDKKNCSYAVSAIQFSPNPSTIPAPISASPITLTHRLQSSSQETSNTLQYAHTATVEQHTKCWWRISFLDDGLFDHLAYLWNQLSDEIFLLGPSGVKVESVAFESSVNAWASSCSYCDLYEQASAHERDIHLQVVTPTAFTNGAAVTPLPTADAVFQHLRKHWNRYSGLVFAPRLVEAVIPIDFDIQTQTVQTIRRNSLQNLTGCTGQISFRINGHGDPFIVKRINALANFTRYCGIGINTQLGMGVVKRLPAKQTTLMNVNAFNA